MKYKVMNKVIFAIAIFGSDAPSLFFSFQIFAEALNFPVSSDDDEVVF